jgi:alanyl-tRNA synthetase
MHLQMTNYKLPIPMTSRLYYTDSFLYEFEAAVRGIVSAPRPALILDQTAFYPASGGQVCDIGWLEAGGQKLQVTEVAEDEQGTILHYIDTEASLAPGAHVRGTIDAARRRDHMQQHSGQHLLSAAFVRLFAMPTVSFHMGEESCTIDLEARSLLPAQLEEAGRLANRVVTDDRPVEIRFVSLEEARALGVRKLPEAQREKLRLIDVRDFDLTACGGTHVRSTGQIGPILLRKTENVRQGVRVEFLCGERAVAAAQRDYATLVEAAAAFSAHISDVPQQVRKTQEELKAAQKLQQKLLEELAELSAARLAADSVLRHSYRSEPFRLVTKVFPERDVAFVKLLAQKFAAAGPAVSLVASTSGAPTLIFCQTPGLPFNMGALLKDVLAAVGGRGGGARDFAQGSLPDSNRVDEALRLAVASFAQ